MACQPSAPTSLPSAAPSARAYGLVMLSAGVVLATLGIVAGAVAALKETTPSAQRDSPEYLRHTVSLFAPYFIATNMISSASSDQASPAQLA